MDDKGFLIFATNREEIAAAVTLAYSIGSSNKNSNISIVCPIDKITVSQEEPFDAIIDIPYRYGDKTKNESIWQVYWATPYEHTIVIDCNSIVKQNFDSTWDYLIDHHDMCVGKSVTDFRLSEKINLEVLNEYNLSFANSSIFYFKKDSDLALRFFKLLDPYLQSYREIFSTYIQPQHHPKGLDLSLMFSIVLRHLDIYDECTPLHSSILQSIDMETVQRNMTDPWINKFNIWYNQSNNIKIQNYAISGCLHYKLPEFLTKDIKNGQREYYRLITK